ncbi:hypothetical protein [Arthrobacter sp. U41]|uniref:hypothetical protein n=1 Tax=Arthrobacter sp. U41 TaxID=1849032 RepID=UPI0009F20A0F|nr:hypothetical protein [Arthrobacter sp. U41]
MEDPYTVSLHLIFLGTLMLVTMFLAGLVLFAALLFLAGAARLLALLARGLFRRAVLRHRPRPLGKASGSGRSGSANEQRAVPTVPRNPGLTGMPGGRTAGGLISTMSGQGEGRSSGAQNEDPVTAPGVTMNMSPGLSGGPSAR